MPILILSLAVTLLAIAALILVAVIVLLDWRRQDLALRRMQRAIADRAAREARGR